MRARATSRGRHRLRRKWCFPWLTFAITLLMLAGVALVLYPHVANWNYQLNQSKISAQTLEKVDALDPSASTQIELAREYNKNLQFGTEIKGNYDVSNNMEFNTDTNLDYNSLLNYDDTGLMGRVFVPKAGIDLPIYHGTTDDILLKGAGHLEGTSLPVGGIGTHAVITAHRGLASASMFTDLDKVGKGDEFSVEVLGQVFTYRIVDTTVVEPEETEALRIDPDRDIVTLVTCTPLGVNTHRILVTGERVLPTPAEDLKRASQPIAVPFPWWMVIAGTALVLEVLFIWRSGYVRPKPFTLPVAHRRDEDQAGEGEGSQATQIEGTQAEGEEKDKNPADTTGTDLGSDTADSQSEAEGTPLGRER